ncbi:hypothetical protein ACFFSY_06795 [Paenibacillus aurantiacus]|uniref:ASCH domain-containing protein n=1 Tax=Paenibacillus aurantiacus TaxID=1936118 RepID=A0ABV5KK87_9BACL
MRTIILSLKPAPFEQMIAGIKKHEFRRKFMDEPVQAFIYVSSPVKAIRAYAEFGIPIADTPERLGHIAEQEGTGTAGGIADYLDGLEHGYALPVRLIREIEPISLDELRTAFQFTPPQSYCRISAYPGLSDTLFERLRRAQSEGLSSISD